MRIGVISDTHDNLTATQKALEIFKGDKVRIILKNQASKKPIQFADEKVLELDESGRKIACYHGEDKAILDALIRCKKYDAVFTGHTHQIRNEVIDNVLVLNPGSTCYAAGGGITTEASIAIYDPQKNSAQIINI